MKNITLILAFAILVPNLASARRIGGLFGKSENIEEIIDLDAKGPNGEDVYLAYKTSGYYFFMGAYMADEGYVLGIRGKTSYYPLDKNQIIAYQENGFLPKPLPEYKIPFKDWLWGFALWILLSVLGLIWFFPNRGSPFEKGCKFYFGKNVPVDYMKAHDYFKKSANKDFAPAQYNLGIMYLKGQGVEKNVQKAIPYFMLASDQEYANAQVQLGNLYFDGEEIPKNLDRALSFYKSSCENGHQDGCKMMNHILENKK
ncbi:tetratricopeptide repeat protein [Croceitalea marina]|jgi:hypothetical protein|uniref:Tetratricopeptide repeat protein n=1 Tax=Croceitalea marina TaxID=1775166 RepID=A0ABW5N2V5_9FLAO